MNSTVRSIPLNFFGIPFGLLGLADCWLVAATFGLAPVAIGRVLVAVAAAMWVAVGAAHLRGMRANGIALADGRADPIAGPFASLAVITPMLAAADALYPLSHAAGTAVVDVLIEATVVLAGWFTGQWVYRPLDLAKVHPGYFLPSVAGGFVASASAALVSQRGLAEMLFGLGLVCWIVLGSIILGRLVLGPPLVIDGGRIDVVVRLLAGYGLLMVIAQLRLLPAYRRLPFMPSFWAFTFSWAAVAFAGLFWLGATHRTGWRVESYVALALISVFIGAIAIRTAAALQRGQLLPASPVPAPPAAPPHALPAVPVTVS